VKLGRGKDRERSPRFVVFGSAWGVKGNGKNPEEGGGKDDEGGGDVCHVQSDTRSKGGERK